MTSETLHIIGGGLAGCEAAWQAAQRGVSVVIHEMKPLKFSDAHKNENLAELVCSNSLRSDDALHNAVGLLHQELRLANSLILSCADETKVPAGGALAVDRNAFAQLVTEKIKSHPLISVISEEITELPSADFGSVIIASGPLTSKPLAESILSRINNNALSFYDAIAPVVFKESINFDAAWFQSRYDKGDKFDYINCPLSKEQYYAFVDALLAAEKVDFHDWEKPAFFEGCLPVEVMASRGKDTLLYGPMKPVGLMNPHTNSRPYAVVQLRKENKQGSLLNLVGFQTKLTYGEQKRIFKTIPGLQNAVFVRLGGIHRNTFICSPKVLDETLRLKSRPNIRCAGQFTGCEGYVESACVGLMAGLFCAWEALGKEIVLPPPTTALGSMLRHITLDANEDCFQPMNINFGLLPAPQPIDGKKKIKGKERKLIQSKTALNDLDLWIKKAHINEHPR